MSIEDVTFRPDPAMTAALAELETQTATALCRIVAINSRTDEIQAVIDREPLTEKSVKIARRSCAAGKGRRTRQAIAESDTRRYLYQQNPEWVALTAERNELMEQDEIRDRDKERLQQESIYAGDIRFEAELSTFPWWAIDRELARREKLWEATAKQKRDNATEFRVRDRFRRTIEPMLDKQQERINAPVPGITDAMVERWWSWVARQGRNNEKLPTLKQELQLFSMTAESFIAQPNSCQWEIRRQEPLDPCNRNWSTQREVVKEGLSRFKAFLATVREFELNPVFVVTDDKRLRFDGIGTYTYTAAGLGLALPDNLQPGQRVWADVQAVRHFRQCDKSIILDKREA